MLSDADIHAELERTQQPGLTLGVTDRDATLSVGTYGFAELASRTAVTPETLFEIGSIGKTFTAILVLQLADEGAIDVDAPVAHYLPWFAVPQPDGAAAITVAHLLSHTAGLVAGIDGTPEAAFQVWSLRDIPARSRPGERFHYSNVGYKALGLVLEAVTGGSYPELLRARILKPLGMSATEPAIANGMRERLAVGYESSPLAPATWLETATADGSIASNAADMCAFARMLLRGGEGVLSEAAFARMSTVHARVTDTAGYGYGLIVREIDGRTIIGHGGGMVGYLAALQVDPDAGIGSVVLQNGYGTNPMALARVALGFPFEPSADDDAAEQPRSRSRRPSCARSPAATARTIRGRRASASSRATASRGSSSRRRRTVSTTSSRSSAPTTARSGSARIHSARRACASTRRSTASRGAHCSPAGRTSASTRRSRAPAPGAAGRSPRIVQPTRKVAILVAELPALIVSFTFSSWPFALLGITKDNFAVPLPNDSACWMIFPFTDGSQVIVPLASGFPVSLRVTGNETVKRLPATARAGVVTGAPIIGLTATAGAVVVGAALRSKLHKP